jgi:hypothetical protein
MALHFLHEIGFRGAAGFLNTVGSAPVFSAMDAHASAIEEGDPPRNPAGFVRWYVDQLADEPAPAPPDLNPAIDAAVAQIEGRPVTLVQFDQYYLDWLREKGVIG